MPFAIAADFPLGYYRGHTGSGQPDALPSPARLHAALMAAAGGGTRAVLSPGTSLLMPSPDDLAALEWLEHHPPDSLAVSEAVGSSPPAVRFRSVGTNPKEGKRWLWDKKASDRPEATVAVAGAVAWHWNVTPPPGVLEALGALTRDVSHLGTTESPVRLTVVAPGEDPPPPTHAADDGADLWSAPGVDVDVPTPGRSAALVDGHVAYMTAALRKVESHSPGDAPQPPPRISASVTRRRYVPFDAPTADLPWSHVLLIPLGSSVAVDWRVRTAVRFHKALVSAIGTGAPSIVTGHYGPGVPKPANRLAVQIVDPSQPSRRARGAPATLALMFPSGADPAERDLVAQVAGEMRRFGRRRPVEMRNDVSEMVTTAGFWDEAAADAVLHTHVPALPDVRPQRAQRWSLEDVAALSVGLVWRDTLGVPPGRGAEWMRGVAREALARGVEVLSARRVHRQDSAIFAHHVHPDAVVSPYRVSLRLGGFASSRDLVAVGQTRHLGGGLLVPGVAE